MATRKELPTEIILHIVEMSPYEVLLEMTKADGVLGIIALGRVKELTFQREKSNMLAVRYHDAFKKCFDAMSPEKVVAAFEASLKDVCVVCRKTWSDFKHPVITGSVCSDCFHQRDDVTLVPTESLNKVSWLPFRELTARGVLLRVTIPPAFYAKVRKVSWPRYNTPYNYVLLKDVQLITLELFGSVDVSRTERKKLYAQYEKENLTAMRLAWHKILALGPHWETVLSFIDDHAIDQPETYMARVLTAHKRDQSYYMCDVFQSAFQRYGNPMISSSLNWKGTALEAHILHTKRCCEQCFPRRNVQV